MLDENWLWKPELASPNGAPGLFIDPNWLSIDPNLVENAVNIDDSMLYDELDARNEVINKLLTNADECVKEEPLQDWLEEKFNFSVYDDLPTPTSENDTTKIQAFVNPAKVIPQPRIHPEPPTPWDLSQPLQIDTPETEPDLLQEFDDLLNSAKPFYQFQPDDLTADLPMQTINQDELYSLVIQNPCLLSPDASSYSEEQTSVSSPQSSETSELPVSNWTIDLITDSTESQENRSDEDEDKEIALEEPKQEDKDADNDTDDSYMKDEEPLPSPSSESNYSECTETTETSNDDPDWSAGSGRKMTRRYTRSHGYSRKPYVKVSPDERKVRKKEQNKNAATRYRQKKKQEIVEIVNEEQQLVDRNKELTEKATDLEREIKYLKNLLRDLYTVKGLIK